MTCSIGIFVLVLSKFHVHSSNFWMCFANVGVLHVVPNPLPKRVAVAHQELLKQADNDVTCLNEGS